MNRLALKQTIYKISNKRLWIICGIVLGLICLLMTFAAFYDYQIDYILAKPALPKPGDGFVYTQDVIARIVEIIGTGPCILVTVVALVIFHQNAYRIPQKWLRITTQIGSITVAIMWAIYACFFQFFPLMVVSIVGVTDYSKISPLKSNGFINNGNTAILYLLFGAVMGGLIVTPTWLIFKRIDKQTTAELLRYAFIVTSAGIIAILLVEIAIKPTLQRERFRFLYAYHGSTMGFDNVPMWNSERVVDISIDNGKEIRTILWLPSPDNRWYASDWTAKGPDQYGGFHPWYELPYTPYKYGSVGNLPFISEDASKSFPSGHETMAAIGFYSLVALPFTVKKCNTKPIRISLFITAVVGSGLVAFYRIRAGAHYLSDVTIGSFLAIALLGIFYAYYCYGCPHLDRWCNLKINMNRRSV